MKNTNSAQNWGWWIGDDEDCYSSGPHTTRSHAIQAAQYAGMGFEPEDQTISFCIVEAQSNPIEFAPLFDAREWLDLVGEDKLSALWSANGANPLEQLDGSDIDDLQNKVVAAIQSWKVGRKIHILPYAFSKTRNAEYLILPAANQKDK
jgi:hypothetical protein